MPCGGILPADLKEVQSLVPKENIKCFYCNKSEPTPDHWVIEWDGLIHGECVIPFLETDEGKIVIDHKHVVLTVINGVENLIRNEGD